MSDSWRIDVNSIDQSQTVNASPGNTGAMVIRSSKGPVAPIKIAAADEQRIIDLFGKPSSSYPDVYEAIQFNYEAPLWLSAPYDDTALLGGALVESIGTDPWNESNGVDPATFTSIAFGGATEYMVIGAKSPYADDLGVKVSFTAATALFKIELYRTTDAGVTWVLLDTYTSVSITAGTKDGFGTNVYAPDLFENNDFIQVHVNATGAVANGFVDDTVVQPLGGGDRGSEITITEVTTGWAYFQKGRIYKADIFMDTTTLSGIPAIFDTLRSTFQKYASYIIPMPDSEASSVAITTKEGYSISEAGLSFYWNHGRVTDTWNNSSFWTSLIGRVGRKFAQMVNVFNGLAPSWVDENKHGGQLGSGILEMRYDPAESELEAMDDAGMNPIVFDPGYGVMITSQRTGQSPNNLSDNSWIAHKRVFDYIVSSIKEQVLVYQITKLNDDLHRQLAYSKADAIISPIAAEGILAEYGVQCDGANNNAPILAARKFVLTVAVKVTPFSERVIFNFVHVGQNVSVEQYVG